MSPLNLLDELFRDEIARQTAAMKSALSALVRNQSALTADSPIVLAAQALKGAARAAGFTVVGRLTEDLETFLDAASRVGKPLSTRDLEVIRKSIALLEEFGVLSRPEADDLARRERKTLSELSAALTGETAPEPRPERRPSGAFGNTLELYRLECEVHTGTLTDGLLLLEKDPSRIEEVEPLMRAAHSIKGAARVVGLDAAVRLAHAMEDHFVRVQRGEIGISPEAVEVLLAGTDTLLRLAESTDEKRGATPPEDAAVLALATQVAALGTAPAGVEEPELPRAASESLAVEGPRPVRRDADRPLRISADRLSRLVALSSEVLVEARRLAPFLERQHRLRVTQTSLADLVNEVHQLLGAPPATDSVGARIAELRSRVSESRQHLIDWTTDFEEHSRRSEELALRLFEEASASRMRPFGEALRAFPRMVRDVARRLGKKAELVLEGEDVPVDRDILEKLDAPLNHILRNAVDHGLETPDERRKAGKPERGVIHLSARQRAGMVEILVRDDGRGLDLGRIRARILVNGLASEREVEGLSEELVLDHIFAPGFSTTTEVSEISGRGVGLD
ncbi:MAG: Hpt domain-containing protein, partial [Acidobacteria bacterium]|nr:Hpt domain-containing protein [Acidobacteriota bacterium]